MSAQDILKLSANADGSIDIGRGVDVLQRKVDKLIEDGASITGQQALTIFAKRLDTIVDVFSESIVSLQAALVRTHQGLDSLIKGGTTTIEDYDTDAELLAMHLGFELDHLAYLYDALNGDDSEDQSGTSDGQ
jgi:hypothetical protein